MTHEAQCYMLKMVADYAIWRDELLAMLQVRGLWDLAYSEVAAPTQFEGEACLCCTVCAVDYGLCAM